MNSFTESGLGVGSFTESEEHNTVFGNLTFSFLLETPFLTDVRVFISTIDRLCVGSDMEAWVGRVLLDTVHDEASSP